MDYADCSSSSASSSSNDHLLPSPSSASFSSSSSSLISSTYNNNSSTPKRKAGRKKFRETRHPVYRGVRERNSGKWVCEVREPNKKSRIWLGTYPTPEMAARAHDVAAMALRGKSAVLNFADSALVLPRASSASADEIRRVASQAAEMFRPSPSRASPEKMEEEVKEVSSSSSSRMKQPAADPVVYVDEDALFNMPGLMREMAEGMMLSPPGMQQGEGGGFDWDQAGDEVHLDMSLWSY